MTPSKSARFSPFNLSLVLLVFSFEGVRALHLHLRTSCVGPETLLTASPSRRGFFFQIAKTASITAVTTTASVILPNEAGIAVAVAADTISVDLARNQWRQGVATLDDLLENWSTVSTSGDAIRGKLGTQGTVSPLFQIDKAFKILRDSDYVDDFVEFQETAEEFGLALSRADSMAYSANFAGGSGKPTPPAVYIEKSKVEVVEMKRIAKKLDAMIK